MTTTAPPVQVTRASQGIDAAVGLLTQPDACLEDACMLLRRIAVAEPSSIAEGLLVVNRLQALCAFTASRLRELYPADVRYAPPAALTELVTDAAMSCQGPRCLERVLPWQMEFDGFCSVECRNDDMRERGE